MGAAMRSPAALAIAGYGLFLVLYLGSLWMVGLSLFDRLAPDSLVPYVPSTLVAGAVAAFTLWGGSRNHANVVLALEDLAPVLPSDAETRGALLRDVLPRRSLLAQAGGLCFWLALWTVGANVADAFSRPDFPNLFDDWSFATNAVLFVALGQRLHDSVHGSRAFSRIGRTHVDAPLLRPELLSPFARLGVQSAAFWFVGSAMASLLLIDNDLPLITAGVIALTVAAGIGSLLAPSWGVHERVAASKRQELSRVRDAIAKQGEAALAGSAGANPEDALRLPSLVAYEARLEAVREWPFDPGSIGRFLAFALIPLGSWLGGALMERLVDALFP